MNTHKRLEFVVMRLACCAAIGVSMLPASGHAAGTVGDGTPASCTEAALDAALVGGGEVRLNCGDNAKIPALNAKQITVPTTIATDRKVVIAKNSAWRVFEVASAGALTLRNIHIECSVPAADDGGAIHNAGKLLLLNSAISSCIVDAAHRGGAIFSTGSATLEGCKLDRNRAGYGGAIYAASSATVRAIRTTAQGNEAAQHGGVLAFAATSNGTLTDVHMRANKANRGAVVYVAPGAQVNLVGNPTPPGQPSALVFEDNESVSNQTPGAGGGGVYNDGGQVLIDHARFLANTTVGNGGAVYSTGVLRVFHSQLIGNRATYAGGGLLLAKAESARGVTEVKSSLFQGNHAAKGGAIDNYLLALEMSRSAVIWNTSAGDGAGLFTGGSDVEQPSVEIENVTFSDNRSNQLRGGAVYNRQSAVSLSSCTITDNTNGVFTDGASTRFRNTALHNHGYLNCDGSGAVDDSHNFSTDNSCKFDPSTNGGVDAKLGPLTFDPVHVTYFQEPLAGSPLIDAGASCPELDQLEAGRIGACDIGAVESGH